MYRQEQPPARPTVLKEEDVFTAWEVISPAGHDVLTKSMVLDSLKIFFPHISAREVRQLVGAGNFSCDKLRELLFNTETPESAFTDPNWEAFKVIDPHGTGYVEMSVLKRLLMQLPGMGMLDDDDLEFLYKLVDLDGDGRISFRDFAQLGSWAPEVDTPSEAVQKAIAERQKKLEEKEKEQQAA